MEVVVVEEGMVEEVMVEGAGMVDAEAAVEGTAHKAASCQVGCR
jgi:hypothetical protein